MKKLLLSISLILLSLISFCQVVDILANPSNNSGTALGAGRNYYANESIYTETEIGASNFTSASTAINKIGFYLAIVGPTTSFGNVNIYMMNVPIGTTTLATGIYSLAGYTKVFDYTIGGSIVASAVGLVNIPLTTSFTRTSGTNLQVLVERLDNIIHTSFSWRTAAGNNTSNVALSTRQYFSAVASPVAPVPGTTVLNQATSRAQIRLQHVFVNDAFVTQAYTLGKLPISNATPHIISTSITNIGTSALVSLPITLNISGVNSFTDVQTIASLAPGSTTTVSFAPYTPAIIGTDNINVSVPADDNNANNSLSVSQIVNTNTWSYNQGNVATGSGGGPGVTIDLVSKYNNTAATNIAQVLTQFSAAGQPYKIAFWDATGVGGKPGTLLFETTVQTSTIGQNIVAVLPALSLPIGNFYAGVRQTSTTNFNISRQTETPLRANTFYYDSPSGSNTWVDNSSVGTNRFMIDPKIQLPIDAFVSTIGLPNAGNITCSSNSETITAKLINVGSNSITANAATVTLKITGANPQILSTTNTALIASGGFETINFTGVNLSNAGVNFDTVYVNLAGDIEQANDTTKTSQTTATRTVALETVVGNYPLIANCDEMGWTYYTDVSNKNVLAVEWGTNTASKAIATASLTLDAADYAATTVAAPTANSTGTFTMKRYWNITTPTQPTTPVNVRFFYDVEEKNATIAAATAFQTANPGSILKTPTWFKTFSGAFAGDAVHVNDLNVINAIALTDANTGAATVNGVLYAQFNGITSFSGGTYASGVGSTAILPINADVLRASKQGNTNLLNWNVSCVGSTFITLTLERSSDGRNFTPLQTQTATAVRCEQSFSYVDADALAATNYYRVKIVTPQGTFRYTTIVVLLNKEKGFEAISIAPNPTKNSAVFTLTSVKAGMVKIIVSDIVGKIVATQSTTIIAGNNAIDMNFVTLGAGTYAITATNAAGESKTIRFVKY
jgi:hypothetical protein